MTATETTPFAAPDAAEVWARERAVRIVDAVLWGIGPCVDYRDHPAYAHLVTYVSGELWLARYGTHADALPRHLGPELESEE